MLALEKDNYLVLHKCQNWAFFHRSSASILYRNATFPVENPEEYDSVSEGGNDFRTEILGDIFLLECLEIILSNTLSKKKFHDIFLPFQCM